MRYPPKIIYHKCKQLLEIYCLLCKTMNKKYDEE